MNYVCKARPTFIFSYELGLTVDNTTVNVEFQDCCQTNAYLLPYGHTPPCYYLWCMVYSMYAQTKDSITDHGPFLAPAVSRHQRNRKLRRPHIKKTNKNTIQISPLVFDHQNFHPNTRLSLRQD